MKETTAKKKFMWNMAGSLCNSLSSMLLLIIVNRISGADKGGFFALAYSTAQLLFSVGGFEIRPVQSTDIKNKFSFNQYFTSRMLNCAVMLVCMFGYIGVNGYHGADALAVFFILSYRLVEAVADVYSGLFQQRERIDISGKEMLFRSGLATISFTLVLWMTDNLLFAGMALTLTSLAVMLLYDVHMKKYFEPHAIRAEWRGIGGIYKACWPLFLSSFLMNYLSNAPKYALDRYYDETVQNSYNILFMPAFVINLLSLFVFRPLLTDLAKDWDAGRIKEFSGIVKKMMLLIGGLTAAACMGAYLLGIPVLSFLYGAELDAYRMELVIIMICGGLNAYVYCLYYVVTVTGKQIYLLLGYCVGLAEAVMLGPVLVRNFGICGAAVSCTLSFAIVFAVFAVIAAVLIKRREKTAVSCLSGKEDK